MGDTMIDKLTKPFPAEAIKQRIIGGKMQANYVDGATVIRRLNAATDAQWDWQIKSFEFRPLPPTARGEEQSLIVVTGELTIPGLGTRAGIGVQKVQEKSGEDLVKGASTDALKKAATLFGVALELYGPDYEDAAEPPPATPTKPYDPELQGRLLTEAREMAAGGARFPAVQGHLKHLWRGIEDDHWQEVRDTLNHLKREFYQPAGYAE